MLLKSLAFASVLLVCATAFAQLRLPIQTDPKNPVRPFRSLKTGRASVIDTRQFSPQIGPSFSQPYEMPENPPTPAWNDVAGEPNTLPLGGMIAADRIAPGQKWPGIGATQWSPPDPSIAVGPNHVVETVNSTLSFFSKTGTLQFSQDAGTFFTGIKSTTFQFDPRVIYDRLAQRWVILFDEQNGTSQISKILLAVSDDSDPNGTWFRYSVEAKLTLGANSFWLDYPGFSYGPDGYVVCGNMFGFSSGFAGVQFIVVPKAPMLVGAPVTASYLRDPNTGSAQIADSSEATVPNIYALCRLNSTSVRIYAITNVATTPALNFTNLTVPSNSTPSVPAPSSPGTLDTLDGRVFSAAWRSGHLFGCHNVGVSGINQVRWYDIALNAYPSGTPSLTQSGNLVPPAGPHFHMGAIASNGYNDVSATFTRSASSGTGRPCDDMATGRKTGDPLGTMGTPFLLATSAGTSFGGAGTNRWGDYFQCVVDPVDDVTFWGVGMVAAANGSWQTVVNSWTITPPANLTNNAAAPTIVSTTTGTGTVTLDSPAPQHGYVVSLSSSDLSAATVPSTVTVPGGASSVTYPISAQAVTVDKPVTITAVLRSVTKMATTTVLAPRLQGTVTLSDFVGAVAGQQVTIEVRNVGSTTALDTYTTTLDAAGHFSVITTRTGTFDVAIKGSHWLRRVTANVVFNGAGASGVNATLVNGDVNGDNVVGLADFAALRAAFGATPSDPNWNAMADLNGDLVVTLADFAILRAQFGQSGDN